MPRLLYLEGAIVEEDKLEEFSIDFLLETMDLTRKDFEPISDQDASGIIVTKNHMFTSIQFFDSDGDFFMYTGLTSDYKE